MTRKLILLLIYLASAIFCFAQDESKKKRERKRREVGDEYKRIVVSGEIVDSEFVYKLVNWKEIPTKLNLDVGWTMMNTSGVMSNYFNRHSFTIAIIPRYIVRKDFELAFPFSVHMSRTSSWLISAPVDFRYYLGRRNKVFTPYVGGGIGFYHMNLFRIIGFEINDNNRLETIEEFPSDIRNSMAPKISIGAFYDFLGIHLSCVYLDNNASFRITLSGRFTKTRSVIERKTTKRTLEYSVIRQPLGSG